MSRHLNSMPSLTSHDESTMGVDLESPKKLLHEPHSELTPRRKQVTIVSLYVSWPFPSASIDYRPSGLTWS